VIYLLHQTVLHWAERTPDKEAFICGRDRLTYRETATKVQQLAGVLSRLGVRRGDRVGVYLNRSIETAIALHGIMLAGAAYVPLDPKASPERIRFQLEDCGLRVVVTNGSQQKNWARTQVQGTGLESIVGLADVPEGLSGISWTEVFGGPATFEPSFSAVETDRAGLCAPRGRHTRAHG